jgi:hypothetical protein
MWVRNIINFKWNIIGQLQFRPLKIQFRRIHKFSKFEEKFEKQKKNKTCHKRNKEIITKS